MRAMRGNPYESGPHLQGLGRGQCRLRLKQKIGKNRFMRQGGVKTQRKIARKKVKEEALASLFEWA